MVKVRAIVNPHMHPFFFINLVNKLPFINGITGSL